MTEENKTEEPKEKNFLDRAREEREAMESVRDELRSLRDEMKELKAVEIMSGKTSAEVPEEKKELSPKEYKDMVMSGHLPQ